MGGGIDGIYLRRYSLPIHSHLVACANTEIFHNGPGPVRFTLQPANNYSLISPIPLTDTSNQQPNSAAEAGPMEEI
jgi:hypothetical protein